MPGGVTVEGTEALQRGLGDLSDGLEDMSPAHRPVGALVRSAGANAAPKVTGALAASLSATTAPDAAILTSSSPYAGVIHYGWPRRHISANPFLWTAGQQTESAWTRIYLGRITELVNRIHGA